MTIARRVFNIFFGLFTVLCGFLILLLPETGVYLALAIFSIFLLIYSIRMIVYYIMLARHMVGGQIILFLGVFTLCCALFAFGINDAPVKTISAVLIIILIFTGVVDLLRAREAKQGGSGSWKFNMATAVIEIFLAVICLIFIATDPNVTGIVFAVSLVYSGVSRIIASMRKANWNKIIKNIADVQG